MNPYPSTYYTHWSTDDVAVPDRIDYWNERNTSILVGLRSSSFDDEGLRAAQTNYDLGGVRLADIRGNRHVIERNSEMVRRHPKPAVFASLVLESKGFFYQGSDCHMLEPGDLVLYDIQRPYVIGFNDSMRQLLFDLPAELFLDPLPTDALARPIKIDSRAGGAGVLARSLRQRAAHFLEHPAPGQARALRDDVQATVHTLVADHLAGAPGTGLRVSYLAAARSFIARHIDQPDLDSSHVAAALGMTVRHLARLFASEGETVAACIRSCRLRGAQADLADPGMVRHTIAAIAYKWGFVSQAHFSRVFKQHYGVTPKQAREAALTTTVPQ